MGEKKWMTLPELAECHNLKLWRLYDMSRKNLLPVKHIAGQPVIPYQVDAVAFESLVSTNARAQGPSSLKTERKSKDPGHGKVKLWP